MLIWGFDDVGMAVESAGCVKVPSFWSSDGWNQLPAPPRPMCEYSGGGCEEVWAVDCVDVWFASMS